MHLIRCLVSPLWFIPPFITFLMLSFNPGSVMFDPVADTSNSGSNGNVKVRRETHVHETMNDGTTANCGPSTMKLRAKAWTRYGVHTHGLFPAPWRTSDLYSACSRLKRYRLRPNPPTRIMYCHSQSIQLLDKEYGISFVPSDRLSTF